MAQEAPLPLGIIQVPVTNLYFNQDIRGRQYSKIQVQHLETLFNKTAIDHEDHRHWIDGYVDRSDVASILRALGGLTALQQHNAIGIYPSLGDQQVAYTHGRHRVEASRRIDAESCWTVFLYSTDLSSLATNQVIQRRTEQFQHEAPYTNGYIYVKLRQYPVGSRDYNEWYMRLSPNKRKNFQAINSHPGVSEALTRLVGFPGIIDALYLANVCKYSAWGLLNEFQTCLDHIYNEWSNYTRGDCVAQRDITPETVKLLEGRAPNINPSDREWVRAVFQTRMVFPTIKDQKQRDELQKSILGRSGVIPSLRSCQANMLYMGIAAQIVQTLLIPKDLKLKRTVKAEDGVATLRSVLRKCWIETEPYVEVREGEFQAVLGGPNFDLAYNTVIIAALRQFAYMSQDRPKIEAGDAALRLSTDDTLSCEALFHRRAKLLGFRSSLIEQGAMNPALPFQPEKLALDFDEEAFLSRAERRWGRPSARVFAIIQEVAFLPRLLGTEACTGNRTAVVLFRDLVQSFLSPVSFDIDVSRPSINVNHTDPQARLQLLYTSRQASAPTSPERTVNMDHDGYGCNAESIEMDIDTPLASPQAFVRGDEDVVMSDFSKPAESEVSEGSHFWEQLILEYQSLISASNGSASPFSDASTLVLDDLGESEDPRKDLTMCNNSSAISLPSYSMVADQSRTLFDDSAANSRADGSSLWSSSGSERCSRHEPAHDGTRHLADVSCTTRQRIAKKTRKRNSPMLHDHPAAVRRRGGTFPRAPTQGNEGTGYGLLPTAPAESYQIAHLIGCCCSLCSQNAGLSEQDQVWQKRPTLPQPDRLPSSSQENGHRLISDVYSTSSERSVLPSPFVQRVSRGESEVQDASGTIARPSGNRLTSTSFYTEPLPRSTLPSPRAHCTSTHQPKPLAYNSQGPGVAWGGSTSVSADSQLYSGDFSQSGHSHIHSYSTKSSPILSHFNAAQTRFPHQHGLSPFRSNVSTLISADERRGVRPSVKENMDAGLHGAQEKQEQLPRGWQGFIDSDDTLTTISLN